jgi:putative tryptophan/tyrosine transport system substrate-binding protein
MKRRAFIALVGGAAAWPLLAHAQTQGTIGKIGYVHPVTIDVRSVTLSTMIAIWRRLGYVEGKTLLLRSAEGNPRRLPELVAELIQLEVGVLIAVGPETVRAASQTTTSTPIVAVDLETDPVRSGFAASFGRPGGTSPVCLWTNLLLSGSGSSS